MTGQPPAPATPQADAEQLTALSAIRPSILTRVLFALLCEWIPEPERRRDAILSKYLEIRKGLG